MLFRQIRTLVLVAALSAKVSHAGTFRDDRGVTHAISGKPTIVTYARTAVTLSHFGLGTDQLIGVYGEYAHDGSDYDFTNLKAGSSYPADPTPEEMEFITSVTHISPSCQTGYCQEFDVEIFRSLKPDYIVMHGYTGDLWGFDADTEKQVVNIIGKPIIYIDVAQQGANCISDQEQQNCYGKSMIEVIQQYHDLARALGIDIPASVRDDQKALCKAAAEFQDAAETAHSKGVRALAGYVSVNEFKNATSYFAYPVDDMVLRMFEELGMPLLHPGLCKADGCSQNYFWEWIPTQEYFPDCSQGQDRSQCNDNVLYPVDMWLYDHRTTFTFRSQEFHEEFPDPAVRQGQFEYWPIGGGIISYRHAAEILSIVAPSLARMERIHPSTQCTPAVVNSVEHAQNGVGAGEYVCFDTTFHRQAYLQCPADPNDSALSAGAVAGIAVGGVALLGLIAFFTLRRKTGIDKSYS